MLIGLNRAVSLGHRLRIERLDAKVQLGNPRHLHLRAQGNLSDSESVLTQLGGWFDDYSTQAPHSALGMRSPRLYRATMLTRAFDATPASTAAPYLPQDARSSCPRARPSSLEARQ